jgi:molecular chaperone DnaK (HSP70)
MSKTKIEKNVLGIDLGTTNSKDLQWQERCSLQL